MDTDNFPLFLNHVILIISYSQTCRQSHSQNAMIAIHIA